MKKMQKYSYLFLTAISSFLIISILYCIKGITPFGNKSLLTLDLLHQYTPLLKELFRRVIGGHNLIYSFNMGLGSPLYRNFFNYLSSPFNIIMFFFKGKALITSLSFIILTKAVAASLTMSFFLKEKFGKNYAFIGLSCLYAFSAFFTAYYWNIMWIDALVLLPLITLGIEKLIDNRRPLLYIISLSILILTNYYMGYMVCIFCILYFTTYLLITLDYKNTKKTRIAILDFILSSLLVGALLAVFILPLLSSFNSISATKDLMPINQYYSFSFKEFLYNHFSGVTSTVLSSDITNAPNISLGILSLALLFVFFINRKINIKIKIIYALLLGVIALGFFNYKLDFIWHAFHVPNDLPYRYSFVYTFVLTIICAYSIKHIKDLKTYWLIIIYIILIGLLSLTKTFGILNINNKMLILNTISLTLYFISFLIFKYYKKSKILSISLLLITIIIESVLVLNNNWKLNKREDIMFKDYDEVEAALDLIKTNDLGIYRIDRDYIMTFNDPAWYGYNGVSSFSSMNYQSVAELLKKTGSAGNEINSYYYKSNTPIWNMMFNFKYLMSDKPHAYFNTFEKSDTFNIYKFQYNVGLMYGVNKNIKEWDIDQNNPFKVQNDFIYYGVGIENPLERIYETKREKVFENDEKIVLKHDIDYKGSYYFYTDNIDFVIIGTKLYYMNDSIDYLNNISAYISEEIGYDENYIIEGYSANAMEIYIGYDKEEDYKGYYIYKVNDNNLKLAYNALKNNKIEIKKYKENMIFATSNFDQDLMVYTSIPYDKGWNVYIDGKKVNTYRIGTALLGFDINSGKHDILLKYEIPNLKLGLIISISSLVVLIIYMNVIKKD